MLVIGMSLDRNRSELTLIGQNVHWSRIRSGDIFTARGISIYSPMPDLRPKVIFWQRIFIYSTGL